MNELHLFAGAGGGILGGVLLGHTTVCAVEIEPYCRKVLLQRQRDGILPRFPIWDDIRTFDGKPWRGRVDVVCGGFPCQDISAAGRGAGIAEGTRSGLWYEMARVIGEIQPRFVFIENSPLLRKRGLNKVLRSLAEMGYDARWGVLGACDIGAPHKRERIWILAHFRGNGLEKRNTARGFLPKPKHGCQNLAETNSQLQQPVSRGKDENASQQTQTPVEFGGGCVLADSTSERQSGQGAYWYASDPAEKREGETDRAWAERVGHIWGIESSLGRVANGVAHRVDRLKAIGNGQVPLCAALAWKTLSSVA